MPPRIVVIGAVAAGPKAACRAKRLLPGAEVVLIDQSADFSYDRCGLPYYISGDLSDLKELQSATYMVTRDVKFFADTKGVQVRVRTRARALDRTRQIVTLEDPESGESSEIPYDYLVLATGSAPVRPPVPGAEGDGVVTITTPRDAALVKEMIARGQVESVVVLGGEPAALEFAEAVADLWGLDTAVVTPEAQLLPDLLDPALARMVAAQLTSKGVAVHCGEGLVRIEGEAGRVARVVTTARTLAADLVIVAVGTRPRTRLGREAGLAVGATGGLVVNACLQTSDPRIYAGGDCVEHRHLVSGGKVCFPSGPLASRQGRIIGTNVAGGQATFEGVVGTRILKVFDMSVAGTGLTLAAARQAGFDPLGALVSQADRAHFYPGQEMMCLHLVVDRPTRRLLGLQGVGPLGDGVKARIDAVAALLQYRPTLNDLANLEVASAPPFAAAVDILNTVANVADNTLHRLNRFLPAEDFPALWRRRDVDSVVFLDTREPDNAARLVATQGNHWLNLPQGELRRRLDQVPRDTPLILICNSGLRSYEAQIVLDAAGITDTLNLGGGLVAQKKSGMDLLSDSPAGEGD